MVLGSTQPLVKMSTRNISWGYRRPVRGADNLTTFMCRMSWKSGSLNLLEPSGPHRAIYGTALTFYLLCVLNLKILNSRSEIEFISEIICLIHLHFLMAVTEKGRIEVQAPHSSEMRVKF
jgi:hypothetical protein